MTIISSPTASTPEKQKQFDDLLYFLAERASAQARGEGPGPAMTAEQEAIQNEMLALMPKVNRQREAINKMIDELPDTPHPEVEAYKAKHGKDATLGGFVDTMPKITSVK